MNDLNVFNQFVSLPESNERKGNLGVRYDRVSDRKQLDGNSLKTQDVECERLATNRSIKLTKSFGGINDSAKTDDRKEFKKMISYVKKNKSIKYIIVYAFDRFSRTGVDGAKIAKDLYRDYGVVTLAANMGIDPTTSWGSSIRDIMFIVAEIENKEKTKRTISNMQELLRKGYWLWNPPRGFINTNKGRAVDQNIIPSKEGALIRKAFEWKANHNYTLPEIVERLNARGLKIDYRRLHEIFNNPFYCGLIVNRMIPNEVIQGNHEAIVSKELFLAVNEVRKEQRTHPSTHAKYSENLPLKLFVKCDCCGKPMTGYLVKKKGIHYYKCRVKGCRNNRNADVMHQQFSNMLSIFQVDEEDQVVMRDQISSTLVELTKESTEKRSLLKRQLTEIDKNIETIEERWALGKISDESLYKKFIEKYRADQIEIVQKLDNTQISSSNLLKGVEYALELSMKLGDLWKNGTFETRTNLQKMVFPEGISYNRKMDRVRTTRINSFFSYIPEITNRFEKTKKRKFDRF